MVRQEDQERLDRATELLLEVIARHRGEDLRAITVFIAAIRDIRVGAQYLAAVTTENEHAARGDPLAAVI